MGLDTGVTFAIVSLSLRFSFFRDRVLTRVYDYFQCVVDFVSKVNLFLCCLYISTTTSNNQIPLTFIGATSISLSSGKLDGAGRSLSFKHCS